jgi:hypothetical protein
LKFLDKFCEESSSIKFHENHPEGAKLFYVDGQTGRQTDGHDEANGSFSQFCECAEKVLLSKGKQTNKQTKHMF